MIEGEMSAISKMIERQARQSEGESIPYESVKNFVDSLNAEIEKIESETVLEKFITFVRELKVKLVNFISDSGKNNNNLSPDFLKEKERLNVEKEEIQNRIIEISEQISKLRATLKGLKDELEKEKAGNIKSERKIFDLMTRQNELSVVLNNLKNEKEKVDIAREDFKRELTEAGVLIGRDIVDYADFPVDNLFEPREKQLDRRRELEKMKIRLEETGGTGQEEILKEFQDVNERETFLANEIIDLEKSATSLEALIDELDQRIDNEFRGGIDKINKEFQKFFELMFGGGSAKIEIVKQEKRKIKTDTDESEMSEERVDDEKIEEGIDISVNLPRKKIKSLMMLSGGERALTSIALIFAMSQVNPPPFIILDETDAALDEANSKKYGDMIENLSKKSQLILITHNRETMSRAGILYGVTMTSGGISKLLSIKFDEAVQVAK